MENKFLLNKKLILLAVGILIILAVTFFIIYSLSSSQGEKLQLNPEKESENPTNNLSATEVGTGWSSKEDPKEAVLEAVNMALENKQNKNPEFAIIFATSGSDLKQILSESKKMLGEQIKIYGGTSDSRGVMTEKGYVKGEEQGYNQELMKGKHGLTIMTISSKDIDFGAGWANYSSYPSRKEAGKEAVTRAVSNANKSPSEIPNIVLILLTQGLEDDALDGIKEVVGEKTPILGGTAGGPKMEVLGEQETYEQGISLAVIYTNLPTGIIFEGGFETDSKYSGIATEVDGQAIVKIDNRPAIDVYNEWLNGEIDRLFKEVNDSSKIRDILTLHPLYRKYKTEDGKEYALFSHPWPKDDTLKDKAIMTSTNIKQGERIYLSQGTWETLLNRIGSSPNKAKENGNMDINSKPLFAIGYVCGGVMGVIPEDEREKMPILINYENKNAPFIAPFTWGEQGYYPGLGSKHGNLQTGFLVIGNR